MFHIWQVPNNTLRTFEMSLLGYEVYQNSHINDIATYNLPINTTHWINLTSGCYCWIILMLNNLELSSQCPSWVPYKSYHPYIWRSIILNGRIYCTYPSVLMCTFWYVRPRTATKIVWSSSLPNPNQSPAKRKLVIIKALL